MQKLSQVLIIPNSTALVVQTAQSAVGHMLLCTFAHPLLVLKLLKLVSVFLLHKAFCLMLIIYCIVNLLLSSFPSDPYKRKFSSHIDSYLSLLDSVTRFF